MRNTLSTILARPITRTRSRKCGPFTSPRTPARQTGRTCADSGRGIMFRRIAFWILAAWITTISPALAQDNPTPTPPIVIPRDGEAFKEMMCRMAVGNIAGHVQERANLYLVLYRDQAAASSTDKAYGLLTGAYYGDRGVSGHGPTLDDPKEARYLKNGAAFHNEDAARLRATTAAFRQGACDAIMPDPEPEPPAPDPAPQS